MILYINTTFPEEIIIALRDGHKTVSQKKILAPQSQAGKLLPTIDRLLKLKKVKLSALEKIIVANYGGSFTALRIGVITANALAYGLRIPIEAEPGRRKFIKKFVGHTLIMPCYDRSPNIGISRKKNF